jgi:acetyl-CoA carboxylase carboxyltransferase component
VSTLRSQDGGANNQKHGADDQQESAHELVSVSSARTRRRHRVSLFKLVTSLVDADSHGDEGKAGIGARVCVSLVRLDNRFVTVCGNNIGGCKIVTSAGAHILS